jgi:hypothetical protein
MLGQAFEGRQIFLDADFAGYAEKYSHKGTKNTKKN